MPSDFEPLVPVSHGTIQTIASIFWPQVKSVGGTSTRHKVLIGQEGALSVIENRPLGWKPGGRIVLLVHGLTGSEESTHLVRLADLFVRRGVLAIRMNMRGCGPGLGLARGIYHSGRSDDARAVLEWIGENYPNSPVTQIGISLGGNATLKMAGEMGAMCPPFLDSVVAVSAPIDLAMCSKRISHWKNFIFDRYFTNRLVNHIELLNSKFPEMVQSLPKNWRQGPMSLARLDDTYVAPVSGFKDGQDYYARCSSGPLIQNIKCKTLLLTAKDDPIIDPEPYEQIGQSENREMIVTGKGGHAAWLARDKASEFGRFWMDQVVVNWVLSLR